MQEDLCLKSMQEAAQVLVGTHDFTSFRALGALHEGFAQSKALH
jgi:tRNA U38,U39,U40 pseudouridine synthase TruA